MPVDFLTTEQTESYGRFTGEPDELQLARYFHLDEADKEFIGKSRGDHNRLGIALQIGCVRFLGTFLTDMNHIPSGVRHFTARQLGIRDITVLAEYGQRENTRREHAALIRQHYQYREFAWPWTFRLTRLLYTRSWISNERPGLLFDLATGWLMQHRITHIMRLLISLWDVGTVFFTIYPQVFRHEKSSIYYKYIEPLSYCFSISFKILIITVYGFMKWYICKCLFCKVYLLDLSYNRNAKPMTGSNELRFNLTQIRG